jgi:hypothetical protein
MPAISASALQRGAPLTREINLVNKLAAIPLVISVLAMPALSFAQSAAGLTRAQVVAELVRLEQAGYNPSAGEDNNYPADIQAAEARVAAEDAARVARMAPGMAADPDASSPMTVRR